MCGWRTAAFCQGGEPLLTRQGDMKKNLSKKILHFQVSEQLQEGESVEALGEAETASNGATTAIRKKAGWEQRIYFFQACL